MLTNSKSCTDVELIALKRANLGSGAEVTSLRRKTLSSHDLVILVSNGACNKEITVTKRMLSRHQAAAKSRAAV